MDINTFTRLIAPLKRKIYLLIGRAILTAIDNSQGTQKIQVTVLKNETISDVERFQEYGFESYPIAGDSAQALIGFVNGNRDQGIAFCVHDRQYRPTDLAEAEVAIYTSQDKSSSDHRIHLKSGKVIEIIADTVIITSPEMTISGNLTVTGDIEGGTVATTAGIDLDTHTHPGVTSGGASTGPAQ